ncbi:Hypothetical protein A7982_06123 [Minicystis rosea]|nr:Hypothetical protein A7982_06123 [Minicystis rosea]
MARTHKRRLALFIIAALLGAAGIYRLFFGGSFDRHRFEAIVAEVRRLPIEPGQQVTLRAGDLGDPRSLRPVGDEPRVRGKGAGLVWAERTREGKLKVVIETSDQGHMGEHGFAFSEVPLQPKPLDARWSTVDVPGHLNIVDARIDDHWWSVLYNLD